MKPTALRPDCVDRLHAIILSIALRRSSCPSQGFPDLFAPEKKQNYSLVYHYDTGLLSDLEIVWKLIFTLFFASWPLPRKFSQLHHRRCQAREPYSPTLRWGTLSSNAAELLDVQIVSASRTPSQSSVRVEEWANIGTRLLKPALQYIILCNKLSVSP